MYVNYLFRFIINWVRKNVELSSITLTTLLDLAFPWFFPLNWAFSGVHILWVYLTLSVLTSWRDFSFVLFLIEVMNIIYGYKVKLKWSILHLPWYIKPSKVGVVRYLYKVCLFLSLKSSHPFNNTHQHKRTWKLLVVHTHERAYQDDASS